MDVTQIALDTILYRGQDMNDCPPSGSIIDIWRSPSDRLAVVKCMQRNVLVRTLKPCLNELAINGGASHDVFHGQSYNHAAPVRLPPSLRRSSLTYSPQASSIALSASCP